jgi:hypothetical protein
LRESGISLCDRDDLGLEREEEVNVYVCGAVRDILDEFTAKIEKCGAVVIGSDEYSSGSGGLSIPLAAEAVVIGVDQIGHSASRTLIGMCKTRGLLFTSGSLRKWSTIYPRLVQAGIVREDNVAKEKPMAVAAVKQPFQAPAVVSDNGDVQAQVKEVMALMQSTLEGKVASATFFYNAGRVRAEVSYITTVTIDL